MNIAIFGGSGAIGQAFWLELAANTENNIFVFSRELLTSTKSNVRFIQLSARDEIGLKQAALQLDGVELDKIIVATGILQTNSIKVEKALDEITQENLQYILLANTVFPALVAKYFMPKINKNSRAVLAFLSARVGSISDNRLGGWYSYRMSKAALNMFVKSLAIESKRTHKNLIVVGLHPGTVDSKLSKPFQASVPNLFTPEFAVTKLLTVINKLGMNDSGKCFAWNGLEILP